MSKELRKKKKREKLELDRQNRLNVINKKYEELQNLLSEYEKDYGVKQRLYIAPFYELLDMLCGQKIGGIYNEFNQRCNKGSKRIL